VSAPSIIVNTARLSPLSVGMASLVQNGTDDLQQIELIQLQQNAHVFNVLADSLPSAGSVITHPQVGTSEKPDIQRVKLDPAPYDGTFDLTYDDTTYPSVPFDITGRALQALLGANYVVTRKESHAWELRSTDNRMIDPATVEVTNLVVPKGVRGTLGLNTMAIWLLFASSTEKIKTLTLEVQLVAPGEDPQTAFQAPVETSRNVINLATLHAATTLGLQSAYTALFGGIAATWTTAITGLTGGGAALDAVPTVSLALGARYDFTLNGAIRSFVLVAGAADPTDPTGQVAPLDYNAGSNNKHWQEEL
jgi:hypothetical protein